MNTKHYVSLYVAERLRGKGYNEDTETIYNIIGELERVESMFRRRCAANTMLSKYGYISAPTILEAMDWLEKRDVRIEIRTNMVYGKECKFTYYFAIYQGYDFCPIFESDNYYEIMYHDRYECMNAAIKKGVELLKV